uniref:hypothetical protein n=1 Tax=Streptomyces specialis TaxID=498367 RepID=UPI000AC68F62
MRRPSRCAPALLILLTSALAAVLGGCVSVEPDPAGEPAAEVGGGTPGQDPSLIYISQPTRQAETSHVAFCIEKKKRKKTTGNRVIGLKNNGIVTTDTYY